MRFLNSFRNTLHKTDIRNWHYLILSFSSSVIFGILWFYFSAKSEYNLNFLIIISGIIQGLLAYLFMEEKGQANKVFFSLLFSTLSVFIGKYLLFEHLYDWYLSAYVDKTEVSFGLIAFYFSAFNMDSLFLFVDQIALVFSAYDIIWISIMLLFSIQYIVLDFSKNETKQDGIIRHKFNKRRFD